MWSMMIHVTHCVASTLVVSKASRDMSRTASTWAFNAVRLLFRQAKEPGGNGEMEESEANTMSKVAANT